MQARLYRLGNGTEIDSAVDLGIAAFTAGDLVGIDATGYRFTVYYKPVGGAVIAKGQWYDTGYSERGYIGMGATSNNSAWWTGPWPAPYNTVTPIDAADVLIAYQPKWNGGIYTRADTASYANSKINLANPGTDDAVDGIAPGWNTNTGWTGDGSAYLNTNRLQTAFTDTILAAHSAGMTLFGSLENLVANTILKIGVTGELDKYANFIPFVNGGVTTINTSGTSGIHRDKIYQDGLPVFTLSTWVPVPMIYTMFILAANDVGNPAFVSSSGNMTAFFWATGDLTGAQIEAVSWAMNLIRAA